ncbi:hypothetical protein K1T71_008767 [Dendrolimus kikuchii]|uniref:Uncharacterized protein n=1 Tax=Dendrolimus kikuchii TaxID=765133 RepID=A0ACC1CVD9_9NEOP|nr:hypothetical protein K1T71_008767 [Dendrolimus kikuchii]
MSCQVEQIADCGDISSLGRSLFIPEREDINWLSQCKVSLSPCGNLLAVGFKNRLCFLTSQWISSTDSNSYLISWSGTLPADISVILVLSICPTQQSSQSGPDWFCIIVGFKNGSVGFYTNTGHLLLLEKFEDKPVLKLSCHTGVYGTLPDDIHILFQTCFWIVSGSSLFQALRHAKAQLAKVRAGLVNVDEPVIDIRNINIRKWIFSEQEVVNDAVVVGLELKNAYDHLLAASTYGGYEIWYRSVPPVNTLILGSGVKPYVGFHYALEGGNTPLLQDVAKAVANKIKSALPGWLGGGATENQTTSTEQQIRSEPLSMRSGLFDAQRHGTLVAVSPDKRLAAFVDNFGRVAILDITKGHLIRLFKGCRDAQCAFTQIFEVDDKKPQISFIKEINRAIFLIIYNPRKGLIDIRIMQSGRRVAVFTATKNGQLIYNTCGLVGAEKNYSYKKLNLPEFQCVLMDPDGKIKKFMIPFFFALDGEHSERSKDLHTLRELRDFVKKNTVITEDFEGELIQRCSELKTAELKKHFLEMLIRNYEIPPKTVMVCLNLFWDSLNKNKTEIQEIETKRYFCYVALLTLFYRLIRDENTEDMEVLTVKVQEYVNIGNPDVQKEDNDGSECKNEHKEESSELHLLEDDNCILERLLTLAQETAYRQTHHKVTFSDNQCNTYKEFISCFNLGEKMEYISLAPDTITDKLNNLAAFTFKAIFKMKNLKRLQIIVKKCNIDPKDVVKLLMVHLMNMSLEEVSLELIEQFITALYHICSVSKDATGINYNEISPWWQSIRDTLVEMACPLRSMIIAMACKAVGRMFEIKSLEREEVWESVTKENAKWGILIGKLEDISILSIVLMFKDSYKGEGLPKLQMAEYNINLKYIYTRGKGSVTELIAKWLCDMGVTPEAIITNELMEKYTTSSSDVACAAEDDSDPSYLFMENNRNCIQENSSIFKWLSLLRQQFPLSTTSNYIIANMCWEYAIAWQKCMSNTTLLESVVRCLMNESDLHIRLGLFSIIWSTYIKHDFEVSCRLVNKVGRLPKDPLCMQDTDLDHVGLVSFFEVITKYLNKFYNCANTTLSQKKNSIVFEKIWDESTPSLVEVAQNTRRVNNDILNLNYQIACTLYYQCHFNLKFAKPLDTLYDIDYQYILEALTGNILNREINMKASDKLRNPRMKFLTKLIRAAVETISTSDTKEPYKSYNHDECMVWMEKITTLAELWNISRDFINRQQVIALYHLGFDMLAENLIGIIECPEEVLPPIIAITIQRLKRSLEQSPSQAEWIVTLPPHLYKRLQSTVLDTSIPAHPSLTTTIVVLEKLLNQIEKKTLDKASNLQNIKMAELIIENCEVLIRRKL